MLKSLRFTLPALVSALACCAQTNPPSSQAALPSLSGGRGASTTTPGGGAPIAGTTATAVPPATPGGGAGAAGSAGAAADPVPTYAPTFTAIYNEIFQNRQFQCFLSPCHGMTAFAFTDQKSAYMALINKPATGMGLGGTPGCNGSGKLLVVPNKPADSLLVQKIKPTPPCGAQMPLNGPPFLDDKQIAQITKWVEMGAMP